MAAKAPHHSDALDAQLVLRAQDGDRDAFTELFRRHAGPAWRLSLAVSGSADVAATAVAKGFTLTLVHLVGIHPDFRRQGVAKLLYTAFEEDCAREGCRRLKAITTLGNEGSARFHEAMGWSMAEIEDYAGPGRMRIVFTKDLAGR